MVKLVRHCQTKGTETDGPNLNHYASALLYQDTLLDTLYATAYLR